MVCHQDSFNDDREWASMNSNAIPRKKVMVLVLDDERRRDALYRMFFQRLSASSGGAAFEVEVDIPTTPEAAVSALASKRSHFVVLDMIFSRDEWIDARNDVLRALKHSGLPLALLSVDFNSTEAIAAAREVLDLPNNALGFFSYNGSLGSCERGDDILASEARIWTTLLSYACSLDLAWVPAVTGSITFLHLSDTHFGLSVPNALDVGDMASCARNAHYSADCVAWSGDVTQSAFPAQFAAAEQFLLQLRQHGLLGPRAPTFLVPGNHDLCWPVALADRIQRKRSADRWEWHLSENSDTEQKSLWEFGLQPYGAFFERITGAPAPTVSKGFRLSTQWSYLGLAVLEIMSEMHKIPAASNLEGAARVTPQQFQLVAENAWQAIRDARLDQKVCIVVVAHRLYPEAELTDAWRSLLRLISKSNPLLVLSGHTHEVGTGPLGGTDIMGAEVRGLGVVGAPHSESAPLGGLALPRIGYVKLTGLGTAELQCEIARLQKRERQTWQTETVTRYSMNPNRCWVCSDPY